MATKNWSVANIKDQTGKIVIVTGANSGIGYETALALADKGATVIMACRNLDKANTAAEKIRQTTKNGEVVVLQLDLGDFESVRKFASAFKAKYQKLDILINNAGVMALPYQETAQGFESQLGINHFGHFVLVDELLDMILKTPNSRIVVLSSLMHRQGKINFEDILSKQKYNPMKAYGQSKLANILYMYELQRKLASIKGHSTLAVGAHPGWTSTNLMSNNSFLNFFTKLMAQSQAQGALPTLFAAVAEDVQGGDYYGPKGWFELGGAPKKAFSTKQAQDPQLAAKLWTVTEELTGVIYEPFQQVAS